jgi:hypothetical protein
MLLLLDEYGDAGLKLDAGSSRWFIIAGVLFASREIAELAGTELVALHQTLGGREFHFTHDSASRKETVFACLATLPFTYHFVACDKHLLKIRNWKADDLYDEVAGQLIDVLKPSLTKATIWFDSHGGKKSDRTYGQRLVRRAGHTTEGPCVAHTKRMDSNKQVLAQLADYVCGAVSRSIRAEATNADEYRKLLRHREGFAVMWPAQSEAD